MDASYSCWVFKLTIMEIFGKTICKKWAIKPKSNEFGFGLEAHLQMA